MQVKRHQTKNLAPEMPHSPDRGIWLQDPEVRQRLEVTVFGGFGMRSRHCRPLAGLYKEVGCEAVNVWCHTLPEMTVPRIGERIAIHRASQLNVHKTHAPCVVHIFSGSVFLFFRILAQCSVLARQSIVGVIFESSPMDCKAEQFGRFLSWRLERDYSRKYALPFYFLRPVMGVTREFERSHQNLLAPLPGQAKVHFIHSGRDPIVSYGYLDSYRQQLDARGHQTSLAMYENARHCRAVVDEPGEYRRDLNQCLDGCLAGCHSERTRAPPLTNYSKTTQVKNSDNNN